VPLAVVMNRKSFEALPKAAQDAIRTHSQDWINKLYIDSMLVYDKSLVERLQADPKRTVVFPSAADSEAAKAAFEPVIQAWIKKSPRNQQIYDAAIAEIEKLRSGK
jgi:TRAP-type transport system periplasmic protein